MLELLFHASIVPNPSATEQKGLGFNDVRVQVVAIDFKSRRTGMPFANHFLVRMTWPILTAATIGTAMTATAMAAAAATTATALSISGLSPFPVPA